METASSLVQPVVTYGDAFPMGPFTVRQPLPVAGLDQVSPFVLLHHAGPSYHRPGTTAQRLGAHPHRGFEPVTFVLQGGLLHRDSLGNEGYLEEGDVQWMTSGSGILHSEGPSPAFEQRGGNLELIQLWVNLPRAHKFTQPRYQDIRVADMPLLTPAAGLSLRLVAGPLLGQQGPTQTFSPILAAVGHASADAMADLDVPAGWNRLVYVIEGEVGINGKAVRQHHLAVSDATASSLPLQVKAGTRFLLLAGAPIDEPMVSYGPFVMNTMDEIRQAYNDFHHGRYGVLDN